MPGDRRGHKEYLMDRVEEFVNRCQRAPYPEGRSCDYTGGGEESDLAAKQSITVGEIVKFVPKGGVRSVTIKVTAKDRGRGGGISGQRVVDGKVKPGVNHYETPEGFIERVNSTEQSVETAEKARARAQELESVRVKLAEIEAAKRAREKTLAERLGMEQAEIEAAKKEVAAFKAGRGIRGNVIQEGRLGVVNEAAIEMGLAAMEKVGVTTGFYNLTEATVGLDQPGGTRYGGYIPGAAHMVLKRGGRTEEQAAFTFIHEYGHHIEHNGKRGKLRYQDGFLKAWKASAAYDRIVENKARRPRDRVEYLLSPHEAFARAFATWTAYRSGHSGLREAVMERIDTHWTETEFRESGLMDWFDDRFGPKVGVRASGVRIVDGRAVFANDCHNPPGPGGGRFCSDGSPLGRAVDGVDLRDINRTHPERFGHLVRVMGVVDSVHGVPAGYPVAKVEIFGNLADAQGAYEPGEKLIKLAEDSSLNASTLVHELGHHLTLGRNMETRREFMERVEREPELKAIIDTVEATPQFKAIARAATDPKISEDSRKHARYLANPQELFARAYFQYIAEKSGDATLVKQLKETFKRTGGLYQWPPDAFKPIGRAVEAWLEKQGWLR